MHDETAILPRFNAKGSPRSTGPQYHTVLFQISYFVALAAQAITNRYVEMVGSVCIRNIEGYSLAFVCRVKHFKEGNESQRQRRLAIEELSRPILNTANHQFIRSTRRNSLPAQSAKSSTFTVIGDSRRSNYIET